MKIFMNQRGLAVLEVVIVATIVAIFAKVAVPQMARIYDKVQLDYEMKSLYSTLNLGRSIGKNSAYKTTEFAIIPQDGTVELIINKSTDKYFIERTHQGYDRYYEHILPKGFDLNYSGKNTSIQITFTNPSMYSEGSKTITLTSRLGKQAKLVANSVGRWRGEYVK